MFNFYKTQSIPIDKLKEYDSYNESEFAFNVNLVKIYQN